MPSNEVQACQHEAVAELFHVQMPTSALKCFFETSDSVHQYLLGLEGYAGMDLVLLGEEKVLVLIRWGSYSLFDQNLPAILNAQPITAWFQQALSVLHQPAILKSFDTASN